MSNQNRVLIEKREHYIAIVLEGDVNIYLAGELHGKVLDVLSTAEPSVPVCIDCARLERLDGSILQILVALDRELKADSRQSAAESASRAGLTWCDASDSCRRFLLANWVDRFGPFVL